MHGQFHAQREYWSIIFGGFIHINFAYMGNCSDIKPDLKSMNLGQLEPIHGEVVPRTDLNMSFIGDCFKSFEQPSTLDWQQET